MDRYDTASEHHPFKSDVANTYLNQAYQDINNGFFGSARHKLRLARNSGATENDVLNLESKIKIAETEKNTERILNLAQDYLSWGNVEKAKQYLDEAKTSDALPEKIYEIEKQMKITEDVNLYIGLVRDCISNRNIENAKQNFLHLEKVLKFETKWSQIFLQQISGLKCRLVKLSEAESCLLKAQEFMLNGLFSEAKEYLKCALDNGLPIGIWEETKKQIDGRRYMSQAESCLSQGFFSVAEFHLKNAKDCKHPVEEINIFQERVDIARKFREDSYKRIITTIPGISKYAPASVSTPTIVDLLSDIDTTKIQSNHEVSIDTCDSSPGPSNYQPLTGNHAEDTKSVTATLYAKYSNLEFDSANNGIQKDKLDIPMCKLKTNEQLKYAFNTSKEYPNECSYSENMAYSTLNDACYPDTDLDESWEIVKPENQRSSPSPINIKYGDSINNKYGSNNNVTSLRANVNQQALMRSLEKLNVLSEAKSDIEYRDSIPNKNGSKNIVTSLESNVNQQALLKHLEKLKVLSEAESDISHHDMKSHNIQKHQTTEDNNKGLQKSISVKPPISKKPDSAKLDGSKKNTEKVFNSNDVKTQINAKSTEPVPTITNPKKSAIKSQSATNNVQVHEKHNDNNACTRASALIKKTDEKDVQTLKGNGVPLTEKCELLIKTALKKGYVENAEKILQIAQKLYPEHDFAILSLDIVEAKSKVTGSQTKEISSKTIQMNITETKTNVIKRNQGNSGNSTLVHGMPKTQDNDMKKTQDTERTRDKSTVRPKEDCKVSSNFNNNKENTTNNDIANREQADYCLKIAKTALEGKDIAKAEKLAKKADRMYPSEEAKTLLAQILQIKSSVNDREVKTEITNYSTINREDPIEAQKCLDIAFNAFSKDNIEKCKRFLKKANTFDKSIDIDVYMTDLQQKKVKKELEIETEKARVKNEMQRSKNTDTGYVSKACNALKNVFGMGSQQETKNEYGSYKDCLQNKPSSPETKKSCKNSSIEDSAATDCIQNKPSSPETKKSCENSSIGDSAASSQSGSNTHGDSASKTGCMKEAENEGKSENELKAKELENKAVACAESGDYEQALLLLETAKGLHDTKSLQDITVQVQEAAENKKTAATSNQNLAKENEAKGSADSSEDIEMGNHQNNSETSQGTDSYVRNKRDYFETLNSSKTENNSHEYPHPSKVYHRSDYVGRGRGIYKKEIPTTSHSYHLRPRPCQRIPPEEEAKYLFEIGHEAYRHGKFKEALEFLRKSDDIVPNYQARSLMTAIRGAMNRRGSW